MAGITALEQRVRALEIECGRLADMEAIRRLRYRYWRCVRERLWDDLIDCYAKDAVADFGNGLEFQGKEAIAKFYRDVVSLGTGTAFPQGHNPELQITGDKTAMGLWVMDLLMFDAGADAGTRTGVLYDEEYVREEGDWKIRNQKVSYRYRQAVRMEELIVD
jgi:bile-acid 7alpha-dehydratase